MAAFTERIDTPDPTGSSKPLFSGTPYLVTELEDWANNFEENMTEVLDQALTEAKNRIKKMAYSDQEWNRFADSLTVSYVDNELVFGHDGSEEDDAEMLQLEFGTEDIGPNSILRKAAQVETAVINAQVNEAINSRFGYV